MPHQSIRSDANGAFPVAKFTPPGLPSTYVRRPSLLDELDRGRDSPVTLVVGLPASGKTTVVADWVRTRVDIPWLWVNCDHRDRNPNILWRAIVHALRTHWPGLWTDSLDILDSGAPTPTTSPPPPPMTFQRWARFCSFWTTVRMQVPR